jgi:hypothetical protein
MSHLGDVDEWIDVVERFTTGVVAVRRAAPVEDTRNDPPRPRIRVLGGFDVVAGAAEVPTAAWGSRLARQLCTRLAIACGAPVPRDALIELLWPNSEDVERLGARLSVARPRALPRQDGRHRRRRRAHRSERVLVHSATDTSARGHRVAWSV